MSDTNEGQPHRWRRDATAPSGYSCRICTAPHVGLVEICPATVGHVVGSPDTDRFAWEIKLPSEAERMRGETAMRVSLAGQTYDEIDRAYASLRTVNGWPPSPEREAFLAVEYAANHIEYKDEAGEFVADFVANDLADFLATWSAYAAWRDERLKGNDHG